MSAPTDTRQRQWFVFFLLALLPAGNAVHPCLDVDTWWHLAVGRYIVQQDALPTTDPFSRIGREEHIPWVAYSWFYELLFYGSYQVGGFPAILVLKHLLGTLSFLTVAWFILRSCRTWLALGALALVTVSLVNFMTERPWHITIICTTLTLHVAYEIRGGKSWKHYWWLPVIYVIWANIHIQFVLGLGILGVGFGVAVLEHFLTRNPQAPARINGFLILGCLCTVATLLTPFHYRLYVVVWEYATQTQALQLVMELQPPEFKNWWNWPLIILSIAAAVAIVRRGYPLWDLAVLASGLFFGLRMQRDLWYGVLACAAVILRPEEAGSEQQGSKGAGEKRQSCDASTATTDGLFSPAPLLPRSPAVPSSPAASASVPLSIRGMVIASVAAMLLIRVVWSVAFPHKTIAACHAETYPVAAVEYAQEKKLPGPLFNNFNWGGYLIWNLPELPVSIDGRTNLYGEARLKRSNETWQATNNWESDANLKIARLVIAPKSKEDDRFPLTEELSKSNQWEKVFENNTAIVFVRIEEP